MRSPRESVGPTRPQVPGPRGLGGCVHGPQAPERPRRKARPSGRVEVSGRNGAAPVPRAIGDTPSEAPSFHEALKQAKLDALKELAYGASHEINNPLANIAGRAQSLLKRETDPEKRRLLEVIHRQALRAHEMIADLMLFARPPLLQPTNFNLGEIVATLVQEHQAEAAVRGVRLAIELHAADLQVRADEVQLAVAIGALIRNAIEAIGQDGAVVVALRNEPGWLLIEVSDTGPGISAHVREHMFDPFFSGREAGRGLGFGLSKSWRIVTDHGGRIEVASPTAGGAALTIRLPHEPRS